MFYTVTCGAGLGDFYNRLVNLQKIMIFFNVQKNLVINKYSYINLHSKNNKYNLNENDNESDNESIFKTLHKNFGIYFINDYENKIEFHLTITFTELLNLLLLNENILKGIYNICIYLNICEIKELPFNLQEYYSKFTNTNLDFSPGKPTKDNIYFNSSEECLNVLFHFRRSDLIKISKNEITILRNLSTIYEYIHTLDNLYKNKNFNILLVTDDINIEIKDKILLYKPELLDFEKYENTIIKNDITNNIYNINKIYYKDEEFYNIFYYSDMILSVSSCLTHFLHKIFGKKLIHNCKINSIKSGKYYF